MARTTKWIRSHRRGTAAIAAVFAIACSVLALSWSESQSVRFDFAKDAQGWEPVPSASAAAVSAIDDRSAPGGRALEVRYRIEKGKIVGLRHVVSRVEGGGVRVSLKTDRSTTIVLGLIEGDGSAYNKPVEVREGDWRLVTAPFADFALADDSKDENKRLDPDQVRALVIVDAAGFLSPGGGDRRLWVANYEIDSSVTAEAAAAARTSSAVAWNFETDIDGWMAIPPPGGTPAKVGVARVRDNAAAGSGALQVSYRVEKKKVSGVIRRVDGFGGIGVRAQLFTEAPSVVVLGLIERDGSSYNYPVRTKGGEWQDVDVVLQNFSLADDSKDENRRLDPDQVQVLVVADAAGFLGDGEGNREFLVGNYEIVAKGAAARTASGRPATGLVPLLPTGAPAESGARATAGVSYVAGKFQQGVLADSSGEMVMIPTGGLEPDEGTIELWVAPQFDMRNVRDFTGIVTMHPEPFAAGFKTSLLLFYSKERKIVLLINADNERSLSTNPLNWNAGEWHHLAASWGPRGTRLYLDGRVAAENRRGEPPARVAPDVVLGNQTWSLLSPKFANTVIDEFRLSSVQRSDRDIETSARAGGPLTHDDRTVVLEHFDGTPAPPLTLASEGQPFHARSAGSGATWTAVAPDRFPQGATLTYTVTTAGGASVSQGQKPAPAGQTRVDVPLPLETPGFYRVRFRLERGGTTLNAGEDWIRIARPGRAAAGGPESSLFGASASNVDSVDHEEFFRRAAAAGVRSVRIPFEWAQIEPRNNDFVWDRYDRIVGWATRHGIEIVPTLFWENPKPEWAGKGKASETSDDIYPPENLKEWDDFAYQVVSHYKNTIKWWIPANEPNLVRYWYPKPDPKAYVTLLKATHAAIRRADPSAKILGLSISGVDVRYLEEAFKAGALDYSDAVGIHPYRSPHGPDERVPINILDPGSPPGTFLDGIRAVRRLMDKYGGQGKKLWLDEVGQPYRDDFIIPNWGVSEETAATYVTKTYVESKASGDVDRVLWYAFWGGEYGSFSLLTPDGKPTLPFVAFVAAAERLGAASFAGEGSRGANIRSVKFSGPGSATEVVWSLKGTTEIALQAGERVFDVYGSPVDESSGRRLKLTTSPHFIVRSQ